MGSFAEPLLPGRDANYRAELDIVNSLLHKACDGISAEGAGHVSIHVTSEAPGERFSVIHQGELPDHALADFSLERNERVIAGYTYNDISMASSEGRGAGPSLALRSGDQVYVQVVSMNSFSEDLCCALLGACLSAVELYSNLVFLAAAAFSGQVGAAYGLAAVLAVIAIAQLATAQHQAGREWEADAQDTPSQGVGAGLFVRGGAQWRWLTFACRIFFVLLGVPRRLKNLPTEVSPLGGIGVGRTTAFLRATTGAGVYLVRHSGEAEFRVADKQGFEQILPIKLGAVAIATITKCWLMPDLGLLLLTLTIVPGVVSVLHHVWSLHNLYRNRTEFYKWLLGRCMSSDRKKRTHAAQMLALHFGQDVPGTADCNCDDPADGSAMVKEGGHADTIQALQGCDEILLRLKALKDRRDNGPVAALACDRLISAFDSIVWQQERLIGVEYQPVEVLSHSHALVDDPQREANKPEQEALADAEVQTDELPVARLEAPPEEVQYEDMSRAKVNGDFEEEKKETTKCGETATEAGAEAVAPETTICNKNHIEDVAEAGEPGSGVCRENVIEECDRWLELFHIDEEQPVPCKSGPALEPCPTTSTMSEAGAAPSEQLASEHLVSSWRTITPPQDLPAMLLADQQAPLRDSQAWRNAESAVERGVMRASAGVTEEERRPSHFLSNDEQQSTCHRKHLLSQKEGKAKPLLQSREPSLTPDVSRSLESLPSRFSSDQPLSEVAMPTSPEAQQMNVEGGSTTLPLPPLSAALPLSEGVTPKPPEARKMNVGGSSPTLPQPPLSAAPPQPTEARKVSGRGSTTLLQSTGSVVLPMPPEARHMSGGGSTKLPSRMHGEPGMRKGFGIATSIARGISPSRPRAPVQRLPSASMHVSPAAVQQSSVPGQQLSVVPTTLTNSGRRVLHQTPLSESKKAAGSSVGRRLPEETAICRDRVLCTPRRESPRRMLSPSAPVQQLSATMVVLSPKPAQQL